LSYGYLPVSGIAICVPFLTAMMVVASNTASPPGMTVIVDGFNILFGQKGIDLGRG
jgi:hypothetical protein